jgi:hypothetical protein
MDHLRRVNCKRVLVTRTRVPVVCKGCHAVNNGFPLMRRRDPATRIDMHGHWQGIPRQLQGLPDRALSSAEDEQAAAKRARRL